MTEKKEPGPIALGFTMLTTVLCAYLILSMMWTSCVPRWDEKEWNEYAQDVRVQKAEMDLQDQRARDARQMLEYNVYVEANH